VSAGDPTVPAPRKRRSRGRVIALAAAVAAAVAAAGVVTSSALLHGTPQTGWSTVFNGYGSTSITGSGPGLVVSVAPERATGPAQSHAALVVTDRFYGDLALTVRVRTTEQLRRGAAGHPAPWEVGWVVWHYTSNQRFYALTLERRGWLLSKQDPAYPGGERFLASGLAPVFPPGHDYTVGVVQEGDRITVSAGGRVLTGFTDHSNPYRSGAVGLYAEDARATFDHIKIGQLARETQ
jgi:hypothetical protein